MSDAPYSGLRVLDLSQGIAGPGCANILGQGGAAVIKVEPPAGDWSRLMGGGREGETALSIAGNFGKRSVCVDATKPEGRAVVLRLGRDADVVIESFRPGVVDRLGLGYATMREANPALVYASITGFGPDGPYAEKPATDSILQALTGMMVMNQDKSGRPRRVGMLLVDAAASVYAAQAIGAALFARTRDGRGRHVELSLMQVAAALQAIPILDDAIHEGRTRPPVTVPSGTFATADGLLNVVSLRTEMFFGLARAIGRLEWLEDSRLATNQGRLQHAAEINAGISDALKARPSAEWIERFAAHDVLCAPVRSFAEFRADAQAVHAGIFGTLAQPQFGRLPIALAPGSVHRGQASAPPAPRMGEQTGDVLAEYGYSAVEIEALRAAGVIRLG
jgi:crotonobetainyl-CoA:carnitine CoA-transferase CaiB-like acyl-CoA transferase